MQILHSYALAMIVSFDAQALAAEENLKVAKPIVMYKESVYIAMLTSATLAISSIDGELLSDQQLDVWNSHEHFWYPPFIHKMLTCNAAKPHVPGKSTTMAAMLVASDSQSSASAFDLVPQNFNGKYLFVESIGGEESSAANAYGEESSAANDCVKLLAHAAFASLHLNAGGYLSSAFALAQAGSHPHEFVQLHISALSSKETIGHQHPLLLHCTAMHSNQHGNGITEISECSKFFKAPNLIDHVLFYPKHVEQVSDDLPVTATSATMAKWISGEMDTMLSGAFKV